MNKKRFILAYISIICLFAGCKGFFYQNEYTYTDCSKETFSNSTSGNFIKDGEYTKSSITKDSNSINNWVLNYKSTQLSGIYGFEAKVKFNSYESWAGMQWLNTSGYDCYYFKLAPDGTFTITEDIESKRKDLVSKKISSYKADDFNVIKMNALANSDFEVYVNDEFIYKIKKNDLKIHPGKIAYAVAAGKKASSSTPAEAWFLLTKFQKIK